MSCGEPIKRWQIAYGLLTPKDAALLDKHSCDSKDFGNINVEIPRRVFSADDPNFAVKAPQLFPLVVPEGERLELKVRKSAHRIVYKNETEHEVTVVFEPLEKA